MSSPKELTGKSRYYGRVDISACVDGVSAVRSVIIDDIKKYGEDMDLDMVSPEELVDANLRHSMKMQDDPFAIDEETKLPHLYHIQTNLMFLERKLRARNNLIPNNDSKSHLSNVPTTDSCINWSLESSDL